MYVLNTMMTCYILLGDLLRPRYKLENDPKCGLTTGGQDECFWDCDISSDPNFFGAGHYFYFDRVLTNYSCLSDCYEEVSMVD